MALCRPLYSRLVPTSTCSPVHQVVRSSLRFRCQRHGLATATSTSVKGSKGPTAMVFLNMGGPSTTDEVEDFLSRLFVSVVPVHSAEWASSDLTFASSRLTGI